MVPYSENCRHATGYLVDGRFQTAIFRLATSKRSEVQRGVRPLPIMLQQPNKVATLDLAHYCMGNEIAAALAAGLNKRQGSVRIQPICHLFKGVGMCKKEAVCVPRARSRR